MLDLQKAQEELSAKQEELDIVQADYESAMREKQVNPSLQKSCCPYFKENLMHPLSFIVILWKECLWAEDKMEMLFRCYLLLLFAAGLLPLSQMNIPKDSPNDVEPHITIFSPLQWESDTWL